MEGYKASYILIRQEIEFLLRNGCDGQTSPVGSCMLERYFNAGVEKEAVLAGLQYKKLLFEDAGDIKVAPVINLLTSAALTAEMLWIVGKDEARAIWIVQSKTLLLLAAPYELIENGWKITPYRDWNELRPDLPELSTEDIGVMETEGIFQQWGRGMTAPWLEER